MFLFIYPSVCLDHSCAFLFRTTFREFLKIWQRPPLGLKDGLIRGRPIVDLNRPILPVVL